MIRILIIAIAVICIYFIAKTSFTKSPFIKCYKCNGKGFWIATRGEKEKCNICKGAGQLPRTS